MILLDWSEPWNWVRQIRGWIQFLGEVLRSLDDDTKNVMEETIHEWQQGRKGGAMAYDTAGRGTTGSETSTIIPLGPGEWDEALGMPLCVVCYNVSMFPTKAE